MANEVELEELRNMIRSGGLNLAGQQAPDGTYGYYTPDFSYGSYKIPYQDPTYSSGYEYARTLAGGMPFEDVVAPGMSFSPDKPMGYTQEDLTPRFVGEGPVPVMPSAPTKGTPLEASYETMPYAPVGTPMPERYIPGQTAFPGIPDFLKDLDFSSLPPVTEEVAGEPGPVTDFFKVDQNLLNFEEIADKIDMEEVAKIDIEKINIPETVSVFSEILKDPILDLERMQPQKTVPSVFDPVMPVAPTLTPEPKLPKSVLANIPDLSNIPMNFTGLPKMDFTGLPNLPVIPQPIVPTPVIPQIPVMPQIPQTRYIPPASSFIQPKVEEIIAPIRSGSPRSFQQPGLFNLR